MRQHILRALALFGVFSSLAYSQGGVSSERYGFLNANRVKTVFGNWGVVGQPGKYGSRGAWKYATNGYIGDESIFIGAEVQSNGQTFHSVVTCPVSRPTSQPDKNPSTGKYWTFEPDSGYCDSSQSSPAISTDPATWPSVWPDHPTWVDGTGKAVWNGLFGAGTYAGTQEAYFVMTDKNDQHYNYAAYNSLGVAFKPDSTDTTRNGLGLKVAVRYIEVDHPLFRDVLFRVFDITNEGTTDYSNVVFGSLVGTYIGVTSTEDYGEYADDATLLYSADNSIISFDFGNSIANPSWKGTAGKLGEGIVDSPNGDSLRSFLYYAPAGNLSLFNDETLWSYLTDGQHNFPYTVTNDTVASSGEDGDYLYGSKLFTLPAKATRRVVTVLAYGDSTSEVIQKIYLARALWHASMDTAAVKSVVSISSPSSGVRLSGTVSIAYSIKQSASAIAVWFSPDAGSTWKPVIRNAPNTGSFDWNTATLPDCGMGILRVYALDSLGNPIGFGDARWIAINNPGNGAPFLKITTVLSDDTTLTSSKTDLAYLADDPEGQSLSIQVLYRVSMLDSFTPFVATVIQSDTAERAIPLDLTSLPNSDSLMIELVASDGVNSSFSVIPPFKKSVDRSSVGTGQMTFAGISNAKVEIHVRDSSALTGDRYRISFDDLSDPITKRYTVSDLTRGTTVLAAEPLHSESEGVQFDGLSLWVSDVITSNDTLLTAWSRPAIAVTNLRIVQPNFETIDGTSGEVDTVVGYRYPGDYDIAFSDSVVDTSLARSDFYVDANPIHYTVSNLRTGERIRCYDFPYSGAKEIIFVQNVAGKDTVTWDVSYYTANVDSLLLPRGGDTLHVRITKGISFLDTVYVSGVVSGVSSRGDIPNLYALDQNYPNPFNPTTTIRYQLAKQSRVTLTVYDILGRQVETILQGDQSAGQHTILWNATRYASGVYFCRLQAHSGNGSFTKTVKMTLMK